MGIKSILSKPLAHFIVGRQRKWMSNAGVTQKVYDAYRTNNQLDTQPVSDMTRDEMETIYYSQYWQPIKGDSLPVGLSFAVFDYAVNSGVSKAVKDLQRLLHVSVDGNCGQVTIKAAAEATKNNAAATVISLYCEARLNFCKTLTTYNRFGAGWKRRIMGNYDGFQTNDNGVIDYATRFANDAAAVFAPVALMRPELPLPQAIGAIAGEIPGKATASDIAPLKTSRGRGIAIIMAGLVGQITRAIIVVLPNSNMDNHHFLMFASIFMLLLGCGLVLWNHVKVTSELRR